MIELFENKMNINVIDCNKIKRQLNAIISPELIGVNFQISNLQLKLAVNDIKSTNIIFQITPSKPAINVTGFDYVGVEKTIIESNCHIILTQLKS
jgi:hypothetical protein